MSNNVNDLLGINNKNEKNSEDINMNYAESENKISLLLFKIGRLIIVLGFLGGILNTYRMGGSLAFGWYYTILLWATSFASGMIFVGLSEIIKLLTIISKK